MREVQSRRDPDRVPTYVRFQRSAEPGRGEVECFVREAFAAAYGAQIEQFLPRLMSLHADSGRLLAALGLSTGSARAMYVEHYLDRPVEQALSAAAQAPVARSALVEVGNFAVAAPGGGRWLITALTAYLHASGAHWAVFTCGPTLRNAFHRLGVPLLDLAPADPAHLSAAERARWGSYYAQRPRVMAARVAHSHEVLSRRYDRDALSALWRGASRAGARAA